MTSSQPDDTGDTPDTAEKSGNPTQALESEPTEALPLARGYEYVTGATPAREVDTDDESLTSGLLGRAQVVEKTSREERRAGRAQARAAAAAAKIADQEREARERAARVAEAARLAAERDRLSPTLATASVSTEAEARRPGSKFLFIGSAVLTATALAVVIFAVLPGAKNRPEDLPAAVTEQPQSSASSEAPSPLQTPAPAPSFNTQVPTITEQEPEVELPPATGTVEYAPVQPEPLPEEVETETEEARPEESPTASPSAEPSAPVEETSAPATIEPTEAQPTPPEAVIPSQPVEPGPEVADRPEQLRQSEQAQESPAAGDTAPQGG